MAQIFHPKRHAWFTPSVSQMYAVAQAKEWNRMPIDFKDTNFMDPNCPYLFYPANLYSAGHARLDIKTSHEKECMIQQRDREKTVLIGDSGGFQAATGVLQFDWSEPMGTKAVDKRMQLLKWLEATADYSMILDWPAWAIDTGRLPETLMRYDVTQWPMVETNDPFNNCLKGTIWNNEFFVKNRTPGATKFLNVLQGRSIEEAYKWYDAVTPFSSTEKYGDRAFEGWALGGSTGGDPSLTMRLLIKLRDDGLLDGSDRWIHVLGRSRLTTAAYLTCLNQALVEHVNENIQISYDAASAFLYVVNGNYVVGEQFDHGRQTLRVRDFPMHSKWIGSAEPMVYDGLSAEELADPNHFKSNIGKNLTMGDLILPPIPGKTKKDFRMDTASYLYLMLHNLEMQINAVEKAAEATYDPARKDECPTIFLEFKDFVNRMLTSETPMEIIEKEAHKYRDLISGERPGVSALEDLGMFPKSFGGTDFEEATLEIEEDPGKKIDRRALTSCYEDIIVSN